ncbi:hypothetical protein [Deinococcus sp. LM3]|uniref:hypothetical protein n=1 Tax=Deinococcus sp. LM3 TaxID=1938608 RepID=UPI0009929F2E|nr:hypothetical protein [Deinococcus sp. LM3]
MTRAASPAWGVCEDCGDAYGLPMPTAAGKTGAALCIPCHTAHLNRHAAESQLEALAAPIVGAWAAHWTRAGLPFADLLAMVDSLTGADMADDYGATYRARALRFLARAHPAPADLPEDTAPARVTLDLEALPTLTACRPADPAHGIRRPYFISSDGEARTIWPEPDTLTIPQPDGVRALIFTGHRGRTAFCDRMNGAPGYRVPAHLWPHVEAALTGEGEWA